MATKGHSINHVLMVGLDNYLAEQLAIWLALEGVRLIALGSDRDRLAHVKQEIDAFKGKFDFLPLKPESAQPLETCLENLIYHFDGVDSIITVSEEDWLQQGIPRLGLEKRPTTHRLIATYQAICSQYRDVRCLKRVISVVMSTQSPQIDQSRSLEPLIEQDYLYLIDPDLIDGNQTPSNVKLSQIPVEWIGRAVLKRLLIGEGSSTNLIKLAEGNGSLHAVEAEDVPIKLGKTLPVVIQENSNRQVLIAQQAFKRGDRVLKTSGRVLPFPTKHSIQISSHAHLEPYGAIRSINHSCEPNLGIKTNHQGLPDFFAFQDILPGDELTVDVAMTKLAYQPGVKTENNLPCHCGAAACRGRLGYYFELSETLKQRYTEFVADYFLEATST